MTTASNTTAANWRRLTPLRLYLLTTGLLALFVTSPFTIGPGLAWFGDWLSHTFEVLCAAVTVVQWPAHHPVLCWLSKALLGAHLVGGVGLCMWKSDGLFMASWQRLVAVALVLLSGAVIYGWLSTFDPSVQSLYDSFLNADGAPEWLVVGATAVIVVLATSPIIAAGFAAAAIFFLVFTCSL